MAEYAGVGSRIVAIIIDTIILWVIMAVIALPLGLSALMLGGTTGMNAMNMFALTGGWITLMVLSGVIWLVYFTYLEGTSGQTLGKKLLRIKVTKENGSAATMADALIRTILRVIDGIGAYLIGFIVVLATEKKQRIGDIAANTIVVKV